MTESEQRHFESHRPLPACRLSRADMRELMGLLTEPDLAGGYLVHAGFHVRLGEGEIMGESPDALPERPELPPESSDVFLTIDFGVTDRYVRQVLVVFQHDRAIVSVSSDDEPWMERVTGLVERFVDERQAWFRNSLWLQRTLLIAGMAIVTVAAGIGNFGGSDLRWIATWLFLAGVVGVAASAILPRVLRYSVVRLDSDQPPGDSARERVLVLFFLVLFSVAIVGAGIATLLQFAD